MVPNEADQQIHLTLSRKTKHTLDSSLQVREKEQRVAPDH